MVNMNQLNNSLDKIAVVTGATRLQGIGAAICNALAQAGIDIFFTTWPSYDRTMPWGVHDNEAFLIQQQVESYGVRCKFIEINLSEADSFNQVLNTVEQELGAPSILVNNAAYSTRDGYEQLTSSILDAHYFVNMRTASLLSVEFARRFDKGTGGRIINLTSGQSLGAMEQELAYAMTKGAIEVLTKTLAAEVADKGITVNAVNPGPTDTGWMTDSIKAELLPRFPRERIGTPVDVARLIAFLASDEAEWITGQVIHSEGGYKRGG